MWTALLLAALVGAGLARLFWGYPAPARRLARLSRREAALLDAAALATFPPGGAVASSGREADVPSYTDRWLAALPMRLRLLMRLLFLLVEHATLLFPAPGRLGFRRFTALRPEQQVAALDGWRTSRLFPRRLVFTSLRAILTMGYFAHPPVLRQLGLAPRAIEPPVREADLLYPPIGRGPEAIAYTRADLSPPGALPPLEPDAPIDPRYASGAT